MRISYINSLCVAHDAISNAVRCEMAWLLAAGHDVRLFAYACDDESLPFTKVQDSCEVALDPHLQSSDLVVFHFGVYYALFDVIVALPRRAFRITVFHNITPPALVPPAHRTLIERSFRQMSNLVWSDFVICDSHTNLRVMREANIARAADVIPLAVDVVAERSFAKPSNADGVKRIAFIGRFVRSKGILDLMDAVTALMVRSSTLRLQVDLVGNVAFSDPEIISQLEDRIAELYRRFQSRLRIQIHGNALEPVKHGILHNADVFVLPTYHEGFCVPILEALAHDCDVVTYDNSNLPSVVDSLGTLVPTGDVEALSRAVEAVLAALPRAGAVVESRSKRLDAHLAQFSSATVRQRFLRLVESTVRRPRAQHAA